MDFFVNPLKMLNLLKSDSSLTQKVHPGSIVPKLKRHVLFNETFHVKKFQGSTLDLLTLYIFIVFLTRTSSLVIYVLRQVFLLHFSLSQSSLLHIPCNPYTHWSNVQCTVVSVVVLETREENRARSEDFLSPIYTHYAHPIPNSSSWTSFSSVYRLCTCRSQLPSCFFSVLLHILKLKFVRESWLIFSHDFKNKRQLVVSPFSPHLNITHVIYELL